MHPAAEVGVRYTRSRRLDLVDAARIPFPDIEVAARDRACAISLAEVDSDYLRNSPQLHAPWLMSVSFTVPIDVGSVKGATP